MNDSYHLSYLYFLLGQNVINIYFMKNGMRRMEDDLILFNSFNNIYNFCLVLNRHNLYIIHNVNFLILYKISNIFNTYLERE